MLNSCVSESEGSTQVRCPTRGKPHQRPSHYQGSGPVRQVRSASRDTGKTRSFLLYPAGYPLHRENGKNKENGLKTFPVRENIGNLESLPKQRENTGNLVCSNCKFPDSKGKRYLN